MKKAWKEFKGKRIFVHGDYVCNGFLVLPLGSLPRELRAAWASSEKSNELLAALLGASEVSPVPDSIACLLESDKRQELKFTGLSYSFYTNDKDKLSIFKDSSGQKFLFNLNYFSQHVGVIELIEDSHNLLGYIPSMDVFITRIDESRMDNPPETMEE